MARITTTDGRTSVDSTLTDTQAANACGRIPANHKDREFAYSLIRAFNRFGAGLTINRRVWLHVLANQQVRRETPAPVVALAAVPAPVVQPISVLPAAPVVADAEPAAEPLMGAEEIATAANGQALTMLMYDIPDRADIGNPSGFLRRRGIRLNLSVWLIPTGNIPHHLIGQLRTAGANVLTAPYDTTAAAGLLQAAVSFANKELADAKKRAESSAADALAELNGPDGDPNQKRRVYDRKIANIAKRLNALADEMRAGTAVFGLSGAINFHGLRNAASAIAATTATRAEVYANTVASLEQIGNANTVAMADLMKKDEGCVLVAADMIQDEDVNGDRTAEAEAIRAAFSNGDDGDVFDLCGDE